MSYRSPGPSASYPSFSPLETLEPRLLLSTVTLLDAGASARYLVPTDSSQDATWFQPTYDDSGWLTGATGIGYDTGGDYSPWIETDVREAMHTKASSVYIRLDFTVDDPDGVNWLILDMMWDDGFAAYLNGQRVASNLAPATLSYQSVATGYHGDGITTYAGFNLDAYLGLLQPGENVLAIHGLNQRLDSSDLLILPRLRADVDETAFEVTTISPADGTGLLAAPSAITVEFAEPIDPASVQAGDLTVNGVPATGFTIIDTHTIAFTPPAVGSGEHTIALAEGALTSTTGRTLAAFTSRFSLVTPPMVAVWEATGIYANYARLNGSVLETGDEDPLVQIVWGRTDAGTDIDAWESRISLGTIGAESFYTDAVDLLPQTTYYYRVVATNAAGEDWSDVESFQTEPVQPAAISTLPASHVLPTSARLNGLVGNTGGQAPLVFMVWGSSDGGTDAGAWDYGASLGTVDGDAFSHNLTGLEAGTTYYFSAFAVNDGGINWGASRSFTALGGDPVLTELMADNDATLADEDGDYSDWFEIHNPLDVPISLGGWFVTDDLDELDQWELPSVVIPAGGYLVVFASGKNRTGQELHTNFKLSASGETLALIRPNRTIAAELEFGEQYEDVSYGLTPGLDDTRFFATPTPGAPNTTDYYNRSESVSFSAPHGFYDEAFDLYLSCTTPGVTIRYTLDGSAPTATSGLVYVPSQGVRVSTTTIIRAGAFRDAYEPGPISAGTYIFLADVLNQAQDQSDRGLPDTWAGYNADYEMDPDIVNNPTYRTQLLEGLVAIPTMSLVMDGNDLFDPETGIYVNTMQRGDAWERPTSVEFIEPSTGINWQVNAGIRIHGDIARHPDKNPKFPLRLLFKSQYGPSKLTEPLFPGSDVTEFDTIVLRAQFGGSWIAGATNADYIRDALMHRIYAGTGQVAPEARLVHLYINGLYWGIYEPQERPDDSFAAEHFGGEKEDWDVIQGQMGWDPQLQKNAWTGTLKEGSKASYDHMMGLVPRFSGSATPAYTLSDEAYAELQQYLDIDNFIDYLIVNMYAQNWDWPQKNWYAVAQRNPDDPAGPPLQKFRYFTWDMESVLGWHEQNRTTVGDNDSDAMGPGQIHKALRLRPDYQRLFADRLHKHFYNDGGLTTDKNLARARELRDEMDFAIVGESARWGDWRNPTSPRTRESWLSRMDYLCGTGWYGSSFIGVRNNIILSQFRQIGLYPTVNAPTFSQHGGYVTPGFALSITGPGTVKYTLDGSDPRDSETALTYAGPVLISGGTLLRAASYSNGKWSAATEALFAVDLSALRVAEMMYHPMGNDHDLEFVELLNTADTSLDISAARFTDGIDFTVPAGTVLAAGERVVVVCFDPTSPDPAEVARKQAFLNHYGLDAGARLIGPYSGRLSNSGELIRLADAMDSTIEQFDYSDSGAWPGRPDGAGSSLERADFDADPDDAAAWRASSEMHGSPGSAGAGPAASVVINEILTHTDWPLSDTIELHNPTAGAIDISGWFLTDSNNSLADYMQFRIPDGTIIPAGGYAVFTEADSWGFALSSLGESLWLLEGENGLPVRFIDHVKFGAAANGESFGRSPNGTGELVPMQTRTFGQANSAARVGPVIISELMYHPDGPDETLEFIELFNTTAQAIDLTGWAMVSGVDYVFPAGTSIAPHATLLLVPFTPSDLTARAAFVSAYPDLPAGAAMAGPYRGRLDNSGEMVRLAWPDEPPAHAPWITPYIQSDAVRYDELAPWPVEADGTGFSLVRLMPQTDGNWPASWQAQTPSPGLVSGIVPALPGDANGDGIVDDRDLSILLGHWGDPGGWAEGDFDANGIVDDRDLNILLGRWGNQAAAAPAELAAPPAEMTLAGGSLTEPAAAPLATEPAPIDHALAGEPDSADPSPSAAAPAGEAAPLALEAWTADLLAGPAELDPDPAPAQSQAEEAPIDLLAESPLAPLL